MRKIILAATTLVAMAVTSLGANAQQNTVGGALVGAGAGALIGSAVGGGRGAAVGAVVGGVTGAAVGAQADEQQRRSRRRCWTNQFGERVCRYD